MNERYPPPSARMRQIKQQAPVALPMGGETVVPPPEYNDRMRKDELLALAQAADLDVSGSNTKAQIIKALDEHYGAGD